MFSGFTLAQHVEKADRRETPGPPRTHRSPDARHRSAAIDQLSVKVRRAEGGRVVGRGRVVVDLQGGGGRPVLWVDPGLRSDMSGPAICRLREKLRRVKSSSSCSRSASVRGSRLKCASAPIWSSVALRAKRRVCAAGNEPLGYAFLRRQSRSRWHALLPVSPTVGRREELCDHSLTQQTKLLKRAHSSETPWKRSRVSAESAEEKGEARTDEWNCQHHHGRLRVYCTAAPCQLHITVYGSWWNPVKLLLFKVVFELHLSNTGVKPDNHQTADTFNPLIFTQTPAADYETI